MKDWSNIFSNIRQDLSEANLEIIFVQPFLEALGFCVPRNCRKDQNWQGSLDGQARTVIPDYIYLLANRRPKCASPSCG